MTVFLRSFFVVCLLVVAFQVCPCILLCALHGQCECVSGSVQVLVWQYVGLVAVYESVCVVVAVVAMHVKTHEYQKPILLSYI